MRSSIVLAALSGALASAQTTTVPVWVFGSFPIPPSAVGSIVSADATATTIALGCDSKLPKSACAFQSSATITNGPSTFAGSVDVSTAVTMHGQSATLEASAAADCAVTGSSKAVCQITMSGNLGGPETKIATTTTYAAKDMTNVPVTITAGADALSGGNGGNGGSGGDGEGAAGMVVPAKVGAVVAAGLAIGAGLIAL